MLTRQRAWMLGATRLPPPFPRRGRTGGHFGQLPPTSPLWSGGFLVGSTPNYIQIANQGDQIYNASTSPIQVFYGKPGPVSWLAIWSAMISPGGTPCVAETFGADGGVSGCNCYLLNSAASTLTTPLPGNATKAAGQGGAFQVTGPSYVYYGIPPDKWITPRRVDPGSYECTNYYFGPDLYWGKAKECWIAPVPATDVGPSTTVMDDYARQYQQMQAAAAGAQAQADLAAAQTVVLQQSADSAANEAQIAQNAQAQSAASLAAAQSYLETLKQYQAQQAALAASIAAAQAQAGAPAQALEASASVAAQAVAVQQAVDAAKTSVVNQAAAYDAAQAATQVEIQKQEQAQAQLKAAQDAAAQQAANAAAGGTQPTLLGLTTNELLLYGGIALVGAYLLLGKEKGKRRG